jgi:hypothetical protein
MKRCVDTASVFRSTAFSNTAKTTCLKSIRTPCISLHSLLYIQVSFLCISGSNPAQSIDVCPYCCVVL